MDRDQRVHALELRAGRKHDRAATPRRAPPARAARDHRPQEPGPTCPSPHARMARGEWGRSIASGRPVRAVLAEAWPATAALVGLSLLLSYLLGIAVGAVQAARGGTRLDTALSVSTVTLFALPGYWLGLMLVLLFSYPLPALPSFGAHGYDGDALAGLARLRDLLRHVALPLATLTLVGIGGTPPFVRGAMLDARAAPFVTTALAKGLAAPRVWLHHVLRNALVPVVTLLGLSLPALFSGAVFV